MHPRLAIHLRNFAEHGDADWPRLLATAEAADRSGIDSVIVSDHVVLGEHLDDYGEPALGGVAGGRQPTGPDGHWLEPLTLLSFIAARTERVRLATHVLLAPLRRPIVLAKMLSTLDVLSNGRLDIGVGVGWQQAEYDAAGLRFTSRGRLLDETLELCRTVWRERSATLASNGIVADGIHQMPKPVQPGGVPIWISGRMSPRLAARITRHGSGWIPWGEDALDPAAGIMRMRELVDAAGGDPARLRVVGNLRVVDGIDGLPDVAATMALGEQLVGAGVTDLVLRIRVPDIAAADEELGAWSTEFTRRFGRGGPAPWATGVRR